MENCKVIESPNSSTLKNIKQAQKAKAAKANTESKRKQRLAARRKDAEIKAKIEKEGKVAFFGSPFASLAQ